MPKETSPNIRSIEGRTGKRRIAYQEEFRNLLREHPGIVRTAQKLANQAIAEYSPPELKMKNEEGYVRELQYDKETGQWLRLVDDELYEIKNGKLFFPDLDPDVKLGDWIPMDFGRGTLLYPGKPIMDESSGLVVSVLGRSNRELSNDFTIRRDKCDYFTMTIGDKTFFVKRAYVTTNPGWSEFKNTISAKEVLKDLPFVKVAEAQLGYQDENESWYISMWETIENAGYDSYSTTFRTKDLVEKVDKIRDRLRSVSLDYDVSANLFYSPFTETFILVDVTGTDRLGNPILKKSSD
ncbi:MAG: hypothetical protein WCT44_00120 [Candidatus Paceibacterota bacterium]